MDYRVFRMVVSAIRMVVMRGVSNEEVAMIVRNMGQLLAGGQRRSNAGE
jgi:hypothetical protein